MLTNNKKSYFVKGIAMLMAMLMVLSVCLTGCGKKADEAIQKAENAQTSADEAKTAADAVYAALADYLKTADGATKAEVEAKIKEALAPYATTEALAAYVKSEDYNKLVEDLKGYVTKSALDEALKGYVADAELKTIEEKLTASIAANKGNIDKALADLAKVATDAEVEAIKKALEDKIAAGDKAVNDALKGYVTTEDMNKIQTALQDKINAADKAAADVAESLKGYVKVEDYELLASSVQEATFKLMTIDREHYGMVMETIAPYVADQEALAEAVKYLTDEIAMIDKKHADYINEVLANYVTAENYELTVARVQALDAQLSELHMNVKAEIAALADVYATNETVQALHMALEEYKMVVKQGVSELEAALNERIDGAFDAIQVLDGKIESLQNMTKVEIAANTNAINAALADIANLYASHESNKLYITELFDSADKHDYYIDLLMAKDAELEKTLAANLASVEELVAEAIKNTTTDAAAKYATQEEVDKLGTRLDKLEEVVTAILNAFYSQDDVATLEDATLGEQLATLDPAAVTQLIKDKMDLADKMSLKEWNAATEQVLATIRTLQSLVSKIYSGLGVYSEANMDKIDKILADAKIDVQFFDETNDYATADKEYTLKMLEYAILRVPTTARLDEIKTALAEANAVLTFEEELEKLYAEKLDTIGHKVTHTDGNTYQVVTYSDLEAFNDFVLAYDALITKYMTEEHLFGTDYDGFNYFSSYQYKFTKDGVTKVSSSSTYGEDDGNGNFVDWGAPTGITLIRHNHGAVYGTARYAHGALELRYNYNYYWSNIDNQDKLIWDWYSMTTVVFEGNLYGTGKTYTRTPNDNLYNDQVQVPTWPEEDNECDTYYSMYLQLQTCYNYLKVAKQAFDTFLIQTIYNNNKTSFNNVAPADQWAADDTYLGLLTAEMCTKIPNGKDYTYYLLNYVTPAVERAVDRNTCACNNTKEVLNDKTTGMNYDLYLKMMDKVWDELFGIYKSYAKTMAEIMKADYTSVTYALADSNGALAITPAFQAILVQGIANGKYTPGFVETFMNGGNAFTGWTSSTVNYGGFGALTLPKSEKYFTNLSSYLVAPNGTARDSKGNVIAADPAQTIIDNQIAIRNYLTASVVPAISYLNTMELTDDEVQAAKAAGTSPANLFLALLTSMRDNMDEVYARYLLEDYKKLVANQVYVEAKETANRYSGAGDQALIQALQLYLTGYSNETSVKAEDVVAPTFVSGNEAGERTMAHASLLTALAGVTLDPTEGLPYETEDGYQADVKKTSQTAKETLIPVIVAEFKEDMRDWAVMENFVEYIDKARNNLELAYFDYLLANGVTVNMIDGLSSQRNIYDSAITIKEYQHDRHDIVFEGYSEAYADLLDYIASAEDEEHMKDLNKGTFADAQKKINSSNVWTRTDAVINYKHPMLVGVDENGFGIYKTIDEAHFVLYPVNSSTSSSTASYRFVGAAAEAFDEVINANAQYWVGPDADGFYTIESVYPVAE